MRACVCTYVMFQNYVITVVFLRATVVMWPCQCRYKGKWGMKAGSSPSGTGRPCWRWGQRSGCRPRSRPRCLTWGSPSEDHRRKHITKLLHSANPWSQAHYWYKDWVHLLVRYTNTIDTYIHIDTSTYFQRLLLTMEFCSFSGRGSLMCDSSSSSSSLSTRPGTSFDLISDLESTV